MSSIKDKILGIAPKPSPTVPEDSDLISFDKELSDKTPGYICTLNAKSTADLKNVTRDIELLPEIHLETVKALLEANLDLTRRYREQRSDLWDSIIRELGFTPDDKNVPPVQLNHTTGAISWQEDED
jgi:hypothetical protein